MAEFRQGLTFDDVLIEPGYSDINSRSDISLDTKFLDYDLKLPIISANMDYVTGSYMANAMIQSGGFYILHRFMERQNLFWDIAELLEDGLPVSVSVGTRNLTETMQLLNDILQELEGDIKSTMTVTIDIAHGHHSKVAELISRLKTQGFPRIIAGNVATAAGYSFLAKAGADAIKVGIGPGSVCTTREVTGVGVPQLTAIMDCVESQSFWGIPIIADGGIKNSGDIVKALAAGADMVMLGSLLAGTNESPGQVRVDLEGTRWRPYRGQSIFGVNESKYTPEGIEGWVKEKGPVSEVLRKLAGGIRSGFSYVGANNLDELRAKAKFIKVSQATHIESGTRITREI